MSWILFSILAALSWAIVATVDKYVLTKWVRKPIVPVMILGVVGLLASLLIWLLFGFSFLSYFNIILAFLAGIFYILMSIFYFKAVKTEEISRVVALFYLTPLFILIFAAIFLGEIFSLKIYLGIFLLIIGAILVSSKDLIKINLGKAFWFMILACFTGSITTIITKYLLNFADFWTIFSYTRIGTTFALVPIFYLYFPELVSVVKEEGKKVVWVISLNESLNLLGVLFITIATAVGFVTLVNALSSIEPFFVLLFVLILSIFYPKILKEEIGKLAIFSKLAGIILMFAGAVLIT